MESYCRGCEDRGSDICPQPSFTDKIKENFNIATFCLAMAEPGYLPTAALNAADETNQRIKTAKEIRKENIAACIQIHQAIDVLGAGE